MTSDPCNHNFKISGPNPILEENKRVVGILQSNITDLEKQRSEIEDCYPFTTEEVRKIDKLTETIRLFENTIQFLKEREAKYREERGLESVG